MFLAKSFSNTTYLNILNNCLMNWLLPQAQSLQRFITLRKMSSHLSFKWPCLVTMFLSLWLSRWSKLLIIFSVKSPYVPLCLNKEMVVFVVKRVKEPQLILDRLHVLIWSNVFFALSLFLDFYPSLSSSATFRHLITSNSDLSCILQVKTPLK